MLSPTDTITALATPLGTSAIAVIRASGPECTALSSAIFRQTLLPRLATHSDYIDQSGKVLDDVLATFFAGPHSYTGEDTLEVSCHGNPFIAQKILEDLLARGCRSAEAGEFTRRAFLNGCLDLCQAEAVMDLIHARSERALVVANQQLRGSLGRHLAAITERLLSTLAHIEAYIDFPDENLPPENRSLVQSALRTIAQDTGRLLATEHYGELLRDGIKTVIIGEPNAGKSSLLNRLIGRERALVSPEPGTTRDFIEERVIVGAHCLRLIDTAGINPAPAPLEKLGMEKTLERAAEADLFLLVLDATRPKPALPPEIEARLSSDNTLLVINKSDLDPTQNLHNYSIHKHVIRVSALSGEGIETLLAAIANRAEAFRHDQGDEVIAINARHANALVRARTCLEEAEGNLAANGPIELLASDLRGALDAFGEIAGKIDNEQMLDHLFASFCIGK